MLVQTDLCLTQTRALILFLLSCLLLLTVDLYTLFSKQAQITTKLLCSRTINTILYNLTQKHSGSPKHIISSSPHSSPSTHHLNHYSARACEGIIQERQSIFETNRLGFTPLLIISYKGNGSPTRPPHEQRRPICSFGQEYSGVCAGNLRRQGAPCCLCKSSIGVDIVLVSERPRRSRLENLKSPIPPSRTRLPQPRFTITLFRTPITFVNRCQYILEFPAFESRRHSFRFHTYPDQRPICSGRPSNNSLSIVTFVIHPRLAFTLTQDKALCNL